VGVGYFFVWTMFGMAAFPLGVALAAVEMQLPALARRSDRGRCGRPDRRRAPVHRVKGTSPCLLPGGTGARPYVAGGRWHGLRLDLHCSYCCAGLTAILLVIGVMDLRVMAVVTAAITVERLQTRLCYGEV
jgi:predicted metal-binding membrane protein